jgi:CRISP-associated protein Cas1
MGTLYVDRKNIHVKLDGNALAFYVNGVREGTAPISPLSRAVVVGTAVIETPALHRLADEGVPVLFLSGRHLRFRGLLSGRLHNNGILRVKQYERLLEGFGVGWCRELVSSKVEEQASLLTEAMEMRPDLRFDLTRAVAILKGILTSLKNGEPSGTETIRGLEGSAAAHYFAAYTGLFAPSLEFTRRNRRPPRDPVNALLSLSYTMLHYELVREIEVIGLDPTIGFYHEFEYGRESLACDLVEAFRPAVDRFVWRAFADREFTDRDFAKDGGDHGCYLKKTGRSRFYELHEKWAGTMRPAYTECVRDLARRIAGATEYADAMEQDVDVIAITEDGKLYGQDPVPD